MAGEKNVWKLNVLTNILCWCVSQEIQSQDLRHCQVTGSRTKRRDSEDWSTENNANPLLKEHSHFFMIIS